MPVSDGRGAFVGNSLDVTELYGFTESLSKVNTVTLLLCLCKGGEGTWLALPVKTDTKKVINSGFVAGT